MKKITLLLGMVFLIVFAASASADIRCLLAEEQAVCTGGDVVGYCNSYYVSNCANYCYGGHYRFRENKAGTCIQDHVPYLCWDTGSVVTCRIYIFENLDCSGSVVDTATWTGPSCDDDS